MATLSFASALPSAFSLESFLNVFVSVVTICAHKRRFRTFVLEIVQGLFVEFGMALVTALAAEVFANIFR